MKVKGIGPVQTNRLLLSIKGDLNSVGIEQQIKAALSDSQKNDYNKGLISIDNLKSKFPIYFVSLLDNNYPSDLKQHLSTNTPPVLSYIGNLDLLNKKKIGFSGSRKVSDKGISITKDCVKQLSEKDVCIVSGYAAGVDQTAHYTAIEQGASTIIVLSEGIESFRIKKELKDIWDWSRVLVLSEFMPNDKWTAARAMLRNNTIIGLSDIVVVVEAGETGGSLDAGLKTLEKGKYLFTPYYGVVPDSALGNNALINKGAIPIKMKQETGRANLSKMFELLGKSNGYGLF
ncbi:DNA-processing protein DprA [uncultured Alistipes sp.]|uniref:DNA-processing protein DprA n=1 Tax=uncultured Alistipes sp. TaxID=538949 RepID=UPI002589D835|nr:DNA-processing protein DprA [uncultured Alistipes sp.]